MGVLGLPKKKEETHHMWIRIESFTPESTTPTTTFDFWTDRYDDGKTLISIGRKLGDIIFPTDKTVSRQHGDIKCRKLQPQTQQRSQQQRNGDIYERMMEANPFGCALVVENIGKAGTFIAELPIPTTTRPPPDANPTTGDDNDDDDDDATDEEGIVPYRSTTQPQYKQQQQSSQSLQPQLAPLGDGVLAPEGVIMSECTKELWTQRKQMDAVLLVKIDVNESRILDFTEPTSIVVQVGVQGSSIKLTWIPFRVVFSKFPNKTLEQTIQKDLSKIGAIEDTEMTSQTTHLVTPRVTVSTKSLIACCQKLPIVTPDYLMALLNHTQPGQSIPSISEYLSPHEDKLAFIREKGTNPNLMDGYIVFFLDHKEDVEALVQCTGGTVIPLYEHKNDKDRLHKVETTMEQAISQSNVVHLVLLSKKRMYNKLLTIEGIYGITLETWATSIVNQRPQLKSVTSGTIIPTPSVVPVDTMPSSYQESTNVDHSLSKDQRVEDDSETDDEIPPVGTTQQHPKLQTQEGLTTSAGGPSTISSTTTSTTVVTTGRRNEETIVAPKVIPPKVPEKRRVETLESNPPESQIESFSMTEFEAPSRKRRKRGEPAIDTNPMSCTMENSQTSRQVNRKVPMKDDDSINGHSKSDVDDFPVAQDDPMEESDDEILQARRAAAPKPNIRVPQSRSVPTKGQFLLGGVDANGWFTVAPKEDSTRKELRQKASKRHAEEEEDGKHFQPAACTKVAVEIVSPSNAVPSQDYYASSNLPYRRGNGKDFRGFQKNIVPRKLDPSEIIPMVIVQAREDEMQRELEEDQRQLQAQQRVADELFRDISASSMPRRRRVA